MEKQLFPSVRYHLAFEPRVVKNQTEADALGPDWADSPSLLRHSATLDESVTIAPAVDELAPAKNKGGRPKKPAAE